MNSILPALALALIAGLAHADGVSLVTAGPALTAQQQGGPETKRVNFVKLHPVVFNDSAFGANILNVEVDGKVHRFVGAAVARPALTASQAALGIKLPNSVSWSGIEGTRADPVGTINLVKDVKSGGVTGVMWLTPGRSFELNSKRPMIETNPDRTPRLLPMPTPASAPGFPDPAGVRK